AGGPLGARDRMVVLAIDNSFSMRQGSRLDRAKREAASVLSSLKPKDAAQVLAFSSAVAVMNEPASDLPTIRAAIEAIAPGDGRGSFAELARALRSIAQSARMPVEAHVFSDMQKTSWPPSFADARLADGVRLVTHAIADKRLPNFAVETTTAPRRVYDPKKVRIQATIASFGGERATRRVALLLNGKEIASKSVDLSPGGRASAEFLTLDAPYGPSRGEIRIEPADDFPDDDRFLFSVERSDPRKILFLQDARQSRALLYFRTALDASGDAAFTVDTVPVEQAASLPLANYAFVVLSDVSPPAGLEEALRKYAIAGGSLWIALGRQASGRNKVPVFDEAISATRYDSRDGERFRTVASVDPAHPSIRRANQWEGVKFYWSVRVEPGKSKVPARLTDDSPVLLEKQIGEGRVLVFASTLDNISNDFPLHASFVPFVAETARYLGRIEEQTGGYSVGSHYELRTSRERGTAIEVLDPSGKRALTLEEAAKAETLALGARGYYDIRRPSGRHELVAVNPDRRESDFELLPAETLALWQNTGQGATASPGLPGEAEKPPVSFWWYL
ncbi:MAG: VWA domain-containing protein, partial [Bryobacteraceae bacterium]